MKTLGFLFSLLLFTMCSPQPKDRFDLIREKQEEQIKTGIVKDSTLLGFRFGMSKAQYDARFSELMKENTIILSENGYLGFVIPLKNVTAFARLRDEYVNDRLCSITLLMEAGYSQYIEKDAQARMVCVEMGLLLIKKYPYPNCLVVESLFDKTQNDYYFFEGNQQIEILYPFLSTAVHVKYSDYIMEERKVRLESDEQNKQENNLLKKF